MAAGTSGVPSPARIKKDEKIATLAGLLEDATLIFSMPVSNIKCNSIVKLRKTLPDHVKPFVAKNKLMERALKGSKFEAASSMLKGENMWFFCQVKHGYYNGCLTLTEIYKFLAFTKRRALTIFRVIREMNILVVLRPWSSG